MFGTNDKPALVVGIVVMSLVLGAVLGLARPSLVADRPDRLRRLRLPRRVGAGERPAGHRRRPPCVSAVVAVGVRASPPSRCCGVWRRPSRAPTGAQRPASRGVSSCSASGGVVVVAATLRSGGHGGCVTRVSVDAARRSTTLPRPRAVDPAATHANRSPSPGSRPFVTPNADFYRIDTALTTPQIDADDWNLGIDGLVERPFELSYDELLGLDSVEETITLQCVSNEVGGSLVGNAVWQGVPLATLLERAGVRGGATQIVGRSVDGWTAGFPTELATDGRVAHGRLRHERRAVAGRARLPGSADRRRALRLRLGDQVARPHRADDVGGLRRLLGAARLGEGGADQDGVAHRRAAVVDRADTWAADDRRRRLGTRTGDRARRGAGRRRAVAGVRARRGHQRQHVGAVAAGVGRDARRPRRTSPRHRRRRETPRPTTVAPPAPDGATGWPTGASASADRTRQPRRRSHEQDPLRNRRHRPGRARRLVGVRRRR